MLVTGAGRGLGRVFALAAVAAGYRVVGTVRSQKAASALEREKIHPVFLDLGDESTIAPTVGRAEALVGPIDILVNNGGHGHEGALEETSADAVRRQFEINVLAPITLIRTVVPSMRERGHGHIVNVTSMAGIVGFPALSLYCGAKFAMEGVSESLAMELRPLGISVTAFAPGQFRTDWAGSSMERGPRSLTHYDAIVDPQRAARMAKDGTQSGDPARAAQRLLEIPLSPNPLVRMIVGPDALALVGQKMKRLQSEMTAWAPVSGATNFD